MGVGERLPGRIRPGLPPGKRPALGIHALACAGILALPRMFALLGIGTGTIWLCFVAALTGLSMHVLTKASARTGLLNYRHAALA